MKILMFVFTLLIAGCVTTGVKPETLSERYVFLLATYEGLLDRAIVNRREGRIDDVKYRQLTQTFNEIESALELSRAAMMLSDDIKFNQQSTIVLQGITTLRTLLVNLDKGIKSHYQPLFIRGLMS